VNARTSPEQGAIREYLPGASPCETDETPFAGFGSTFRALGFSRIRGLQGLFEPLPRYSATTVISEQFHVGVYDCSPQSDGIQLVGVDV
jgi:hypothetical protein